MLTCAPGNLGQKGKELEPEDLQTPTLKGQVYTTGRGGSGNMAKNNDPDAARRAQDVTAPARRESATTHVGRGGAANIFKPSPEELAAMKQQQWESAVDEKEGKGFADKGKEWILKKAGRV